MSISRRNARLSLTISFLSELMFVVPIWLIFGTDELGLSLTTTTVLYMAVWLVGGLLDIPTGALADRLGRKKVFLIGASLMALYPIGYILELPVPLILALCLLAGLGSALRSGTVFPLTYAAYKLENRSEAEYHTFLSNSNTALFSARALSGVLGGAMYAYSPHVPYVAVLAVYLCIIAVGCFLVEVGERSTVSNRTHVRETAAALLNQQLLVLLLVTYVAGQMVGEAAWTAFQPFFKNDGLSAAEIGIIFSTIAACSALGAYCTRFTMRKIGALLTQLVVCALITTTTLLLLVPSNVAHIIAIVPAGFGFGIALTPITATVQKYIASKYHSTALSIVSVAQYCTFGVAALFVSKIIDSFGVDTTRLILFIEGLVMTALITALYIRYRKSDELAVVVNKKSPRRASTDAP